MALDPYEPSDSQTPRPHTGDEFSHLSPEEFETLPSINDFEMEPALPAPPRFCSRCGSAWELHWTECEGCITKAVEKVQLAEPTTTDGNPLTSALALYFVILATFIFPAFASEKDVAGAVQVVSIVDSIIVLAWAAAVGMSGVGGIGWRVQPKWLALAAAAGVGTFALAAVIIGAMVNLLGLEAMEISDLYPDLKNQFALAFLFVCVQPAIIEELAFRGIILTGLRKAMSDRDAIIVSSLMFAILHLALFSVPHLFVMAVIMSVIRIRTGSLLPCVVLHLVHNLLTLLSEMNGWF